MGRCIILRRNSARRELFPRDLRGHHVQLIAYSRIAVMPVKLVDYIDAIARSPLADWATLAPWQLTHEASARVRALLATVGPDYRIEGEIALHHTAHVEPGAVLKGPLIVGPHCFIAASAYLRNGNWLGSRCIIGPGAELKSSFMFDGSKLAHFNFVGDSVLGQDVNLEAGSIVCNYRNERPDKTVYVRMGERLHSTGCEKFGALLADHCRIGANAVLAPGSVLTSGTVIPRLSLHDLQ
jgi:bifunctional N-acetylglucosamine-1-phosphate-uridyltransferase/glucosamine-1-phosphate-acetyltransferase GlmU-like protein